uniref:Peptidase C14 caspase domain-containing protein n=1 Tax=Eutreptiella gymnastica TaxID=73025 RepID=A0A7S4FRG5_9EUGL|mmetsp:Transcript_46837/g.76885  ORF Transcript_46837/g.76885 Transcript_46837/m.76885 type:complete len:456 (-) Transcript_46837:411-1778(-)
MQRWVGETKSFRPDEPGLSRSMLYNLPDLDWPRSPYQGKPYYNHVSHTPWANRDETCSIMSMGSRATSSMARATSSMARATPSMASLGSPSRGPSVRMSSSMHSNVSNRTPRSRTSSCRSKAVLIGINYKDKTSPLYGSVNDALCIEQFLASQGWNVDTRNCRLLVDDGRERCRMPTEKNILDALDWLTMDVNIGDALFFSFSGKGRQLSTAEDNGMTCGLLTCDGGTIDPYTLSELLVSRVPVGVQLTCIIDCYQGGFPFVFPFVYQPNNSMQVQRRPTSEREMDDIGQIIVFSVLSAKQGQGRSAAIDGGACTNALLSILAQAGKQSYGELLLWMQRKVRQRAITETPCIACNIQLNLEEEVSLWPSRKHIKPLPSCTELNPLLPAAMSQSAAPRPERHAKPPTPSRGNSSTYRTRAQQFMRGGQDGAQPAGSGRRISRPTLSNRFLGQWGSR